MISKIGGRSKEIWEEAYKAKAGIYQREGVILGVYALTESTDTILPCLPYAEVDGRPVKKWELMMIPIGDGAPIGSVDYYKALHLLKQEKGVEKNGNVLIKALSKSEMHDLYNKCLLL